MYSHRLKQGRATGHSRRLVTMQLKPTVVQKHNTHLLPLVRGVKSGSTSGPSPFCSACLMAGSANGAEAPSSCSFCFLFSLIFTVSCLCSLVALTRVCKRPEEVLYPGSGLVLWEGVVPHQHKDMQCIWAYYRLSHELEGPDRTFQTLSTGV
jgi:hypothetical protein